MIREAGLALQLSSDGQNFIVGEYIKPIDAQTWFVERVDNGFLVKSKAIGQYIGFELSREEGLRLIVGGRGIAKVW